MKKLPEIEFLRGVAILAVIGIHTTLCFPLLQEVLMRIAVPLFVGISGFCLSYSQENNFSIRKFYAGRLSLLLTPYLIFSVFYTVAYGITKGFPAPGMIVWNFLTGSAAPHLWFFRLIAELYLIYPFIRYQSRWNIAFIVLTLVVQMTAEQYFKCYFEGPTWIELALNFLPFVFYFSFGIYLSRHTICAAPSFMLKGLFYYTIRTFGKYAFSIYLIHVFFLAIFSKMIHLNSLWLQQALIFLATAEISLVAVWLIHLTPVSRVIFSAGEKQK